MKTSDHIDTGHKDGPQSEASRTAETNSQLHFVAMTHHQGMKHNPKGTADHTTSQPGHQKIAHAAMSHSMTGQPDYAMAGHDMMGGMLP